MRGRSAIRSLRRRAVSGKQGTRIDRVELIRYAGPGRVLGHSHGLVVLLRASVSGEVRTGTGEAVVAPGQGDAAWSRLHEIAGVLAGVTLPASVDATTPLRDMAAWTPVRAVDSGTVRAAKLATEMALTDLLLKTGALRSPVPGGAAVSPAQPTHRLPAAPPGSTRETLSETLASDSGDAWALRLRLTGDADLDLAWLAAAAGIERDAGRQRPIWLVGGGRDEEAAQRLVAGVATLIRDGGLPERLLLEEPLRRRRQSSLAKARDRAALSRRRSALSRLQEAADRALGYDRPDQVDVPRLLVVASDSVSAVAQVARLGQAWPLGGYSLSPPRWGSLQAFRDAAVLARRQSPATLVLLGGGRGSGLSAAAFEWLAAVTPEIDRYVPDPPVGHWPELATFPSEDRITGLSGGIDLGELAEYADRVDAVPPDPRPATVAEPNRFPDHPLPGEALARRSMLLETEALRRGLRTRRLSRDFFLADDPPTGTTIGFSDSESTLTSAAASVSAARKGVARQLLAAYGVPVPEGATCAVEQRDDVLAAAAGLGFPLVVKPAGGSKGVAVTTGIESPEALAAALDEVAASKYAETGVVVERFVTGTDYRVLATRDELLSVVRREPASVVGDGRRSVEELVLSANAARRQNPHLAKRTIKLDARTDAQLSKQGLDRHLTPEAGRRVRLRAEGNFSLGGESYEVMDAAHPSLRDLAMAAVRAIPGLPHAGLDIIMEDHQRPMDDQQVAVIEVNSRPVQSIHHFPMFGPPRDVSAHLVREAVTAAGLPVAAPAEDLTVRLTVRGRVQRVGYRRWMARIAKELKVTGWVANSDEEPDRVDALVHGPARWVGMAVRLAFDGPSGARVHEVLTEPEDLPVLGGFTIRSSGGADDHE